VIAPGAHDFEDAAEAFVIGDVVADEVRVAHRARVGGRVYKEDRREGEGGLGGGCQPWDFVHTRLRDLRLVAKRSATGCKDGFWGIQGQETGGVCAAMLMRVQEGGVGGRGIGGGAAEQGDCGLLWA
jgi:hypothetical protein